MGFTVGFLLFYLLDTMVLVVEWAVISINLGRNCFVVLGTSFLAYMLNIYALKRLRASTVGFYIYLQPVLATIVALILGSDKLDAIKILASLIIFAGYTLWKESKTESLSILYTNKFPYFPPSVVMIQSMTGFEEQY